MKMVSLNIYYQNVRGLRTKTHSFLRNVCLNSYDIIILTETWLMDSVYSSELFDGRYLVWRRDRDYSRTSQTRGGGVLIAVRCDLTVVERCDWRSTAEDIWISVTMKRSRPTVTYNLHICGVYLCKENAGNSYNTQLQNYTNSLSNLMSSHLLDKFVIVGDFNFGSQVEWTYDTDSTGLSPVNCTCQYLSEFFDTSDTCNLSQFNNVRNINGRLLDLVFSNDHVTVQECTALATPVDSHHKPLLIQADFVELHKLDQKISTKYLFHRGNYEAIRSALDRVDWVSLLSSESLDRAVTDFYNKIYEIRDQYIPKKSMRQSSHPPWYTSALVKALKEKHKFHRKYKLYGNIADYHTFSLLRARVVQLEQSCFNTYIANVESSIITNPKCFWTFIKTKKNYSTFPNVMRYQDTAADTGIEISNLFAKYFHSTFLNRSTTYSDLVPSTVTPSTVGCINTVQVSHEYVLKLLKTLDLGKSGGPDSIPPVFIVNCAESLVVPICIIYKRSLKEGVVPHIWKSAFITPVLKKGDKSDIENYRPISKLCLFAKIFERVVYNQVYAAVQSGLGDAQHGFLRKRSTTSNLILATDFITKGMEQRAQVDVIYTDYSKCFDRIDHRVLLNKLWAAGIHGDLYRWFCSYIDNRTQAVVLQGYASGWCTIPSGVPQGSLLGPLLFTIFIADITSCFKNSYVLLYADDMKILKVVRSSTDVEHLQDDLDRFVEYCESNKLQLNVSKCSHITFSRQTSRIGNGYLLNHQHITRVTHAKDLGVIFDNKLLFDKHVNNIVQKASKVLGFVIRSTACFQSLKPLKILYCSYVRSQLEYASQVWNPQYQVYISRIESIQRRFLRYLDIKAHQFSADYIERCRRYHFLPLEYRRSISDVCYLANIVNGSIDCPDLLLNVSLRTNQLSFRERPLLVVPFASTNYRRNSFFLRSANIFNKYATDLHIDLFCTSSKAIRGAFSKKFFEQ